MTRGSYHVTPTMSRRMRCVYGALICVIVTSMLAALAGMCYLALQVYLERTAATDDPMQAGKYVVIMALTTSSRAPENWTTSSNDVTHQSWGHFATSPRHVTEAATVETETTARPTSPWHRVTDEDLAEISRRLWDLDGNRIPIQEYSLNLQNSTVRSDHEDRAFKSLFSRMDADLSTWSVTYSRFIPLLDNYNALVRSAEQLTAHNWQEVTEFLDAALQSDVMRALGDFLTEKDLINDDTGPLRQLLFSLWFDLYSRSPRYNESDSSGFEHVFVGEIRGSRTMGFHNWIHFYNQELQGHANYQGYLTYRHNMPRYINIRLSWHGRMKRQSSFLIGVSPEYDMALYTLCALARLNRHCPVYVDNRALIVQVFDISHIPGLQIGTAFPEIP